MQQTGMKLGIYSNKKYRQSDRELRIDLDKFWVNPKVSEDFMKLVPKPFIPYTLSELEKLFGINSEKKLEEAALKRIHNIKKLGLKLIHKGHSDDKSGIPNPSD